MRRVITEYFSDDREDVVHTRDVSWSEVRQARNKALEACDWRALKDVTLTTAWRDYRSALRDLPQNHSESNDACDNWPVMPDE